MKAGDRVRIVRSDEPELAEYLGKEGVVREYRPRVPFPVYVDFDGASENIPFSEDEVEVIDALAE